MNRSVAASILGLCVLLHPSAEANEPLRSEDAKLLASDGAVPDGLGNVVSIDGGTVVSGAQLWDGVYEQVGQVYVWAPPPGGWVGTLDESARLGICDPPAGNRRFGSGVGIGGSTIAVGVYYDSVGAPDTGSGYIFDRGAGWSTTCQPTASRVYAPDRAADDRFGFSADADGPVAVFGAVRDDFSGLDNAGSVHVFRDGSHEAKLVAPTPLSADYAGNSVSVSGQWVMVGVPVVSNANRAGSVDVWRYDGTGWNHFQRLAPPDPNPQDRFGIFVDVRGELAIVGRANQGGAAYVYRFDGSTWSFEAKLVHPDGSGAFGQAVGIDGNLAVVGARTDNTVDDATGAVFVFKHDDGGTPGDPVDDSWPLQCRLVASDAERYDYLGSSVAIEGNLVGAGAPGTPNGAVYVYELDESCGAVPVTNPSSQETALEQLRGASTREVGLGVEAGYPRSVSMNVAAVGTTGEERARDFLERYAALYLLDHPDVGLVHELTQGDATDPQIVRFTQTFRGLPVYGAEIAVMIAEIGGEARIVSTSGGMMPAITAYSGHPAELDLDLDPAITAGMAEASAAAALSIPPDPILGCSALVIHDPVVRGEPSDPRLAWRVTLGSPGNATQVIVDAETSEVLFSRPMQATGAGLDDADIAMWDAQFVPYCPGEAILYGDAHTMAPSYEGTLDAPVVWFAIRQTYLYYHDVLGRHSYDDGGGWIHTIINTLFLDAQGNSRGANAAAHVSCGIGYTPGYGSLDVTAHEFTHMVDQSTSELEYVNQSGALSESFADIMGAAVDPDDWLLAEDRTNGAGAIRDMSNPPAFNDPDRLSNWIMTTADNGGVHSNSGIQNKAYYLMADGGFFNGVLVNSIGRTAMARLAYQTLISLPSNATMADARWTAVQIAWIWSNTGTFSSNQLCGVRNAFAAVEMGVGDSDCDGVPDNDGIDVDGDGILTDGDVSGSSTDNPCNGPMEWYLCDDNCTDVFNPDQSDFDNDGLGDRCDWDANNDGLADAWHPCWPQPYRDVDQDGEPSCTDPDDDGDDVNEDGDGSGQSWDNPCPSGVTTNCDDNCPGVPNPDQFDGNDNGQGDACDPDRDGDGFYSDTDNCQFVPNPDQADADMDGIGDACDLCPNDFDDNGGAYTFAYPELGIDPRPYQPDSDNDGIPDTCDTFAHGAISLLLDELPFGRNRRVVPDGIDHVLTFEIPSGDESIVRTFLPACETGSSEAVNPDEWVEIALTDLPGTVDAWVEDCSGNSPARVRPHQNDASLRGLRFRPRCDREYSLMFSARPDFPGGSFDVDIVAGVVEQTEDNPWSNPGGQFVGPPQLPDDTDADGLWDTIDRCPDAPDPTNADGDGDGIGDVCDICPLIANPDQQPAAFATIYPYANDAFTWSGAVAFDYAVGDLDDFPEYLPTHAGSSEPADLFGFPNDLPDRAWFLLKHPDCGSWGSPTRDAVLP